MPHTLKDSQIKELDIGDKIWFIDTTNTICPAVIIGKLLVKKEMTYFVERNDNYNKQLTIRDLILYYFKNRIDAINYLRDELSREQDKMRKKFDRLNEMALAEHPLTYTTKVEATNSYHPAINFDHIKRDHLNDDQR